MGLSQTEFRKLPEIFVNDLLARRLKHEVAFLFGSPRNLGALALLAFLAGLAGPFGTYEAYSPLARHLYWVLIVIGTAAAGHVTGTTVEHLLGRRNWPVLPRLLVAAALTAQPVFGVVVVVLLGFGFRPDGEDLLMLYIQCAAVVGSVTALGFFTARARGTRPDVAATPRILTRLPGTKRGRLIRLAAQDHYVEVVTAGGRTLLPMRFRDAIAETAPETGAQVHRSHWVALHAVSGRCRLKDRNGLQLCDGSIVPMGRKFRSLAREQGIS